MMGHLQTRTNKVKQGQTRTNKDKHLQTRSNKVKQGRTRSNKAKQGRTRTNKDEQGQTPPNKAKQGKRLSRKGNTFQARICFSIKGYHPIKCKSLQVVGVSGQGKAVVSDGRYGVIGG